MFYTIYDAIVFKADKDGIKEDEVKKRLRKRGLTSEQLGLLKNNCTMEFITLIGKVNGLLITNIMWKK